MWQLAVRDYSLETSERAEYRRGAAISSTDSAEARCRYSTLISVLERSQDKEYRRHCCAKFDIHPIHGLGAEDSPTDVSHEGVSFITVGFPCA